MNFFKTNNIKLAKNKVEEERDLLKITLDHVLQDNINLKQQAEDMKITVKHNKALLKEYIENITNKDKTVEKMSNVIDHLNERLHNLLEHNKSISKKQNPNNTTIQSNNIKHNTLFTNIHHPHITSTQPYTKTDHNNEEPHKISLNTTPIIRDQPSLNTSKLIQSKNSVINLNNNYTYNYKIQNEDKMKQVCIFINSYSLVYEKSHESKM